MATLAIPAPPANSGAQAANAPLPALTVPAPAAAPSRAPFVAAASITLSGGAVLPLQSAVTVPLMGRFFHIGPVDYDESMWT